jgi:hypothetical protein
MDKRDWAVAVLLALTAALGIVGVASLIVAESMITEMSRAVQ